MNIPEVNQAEQTLQRQADLLDQTYDAIFVWEFDGHIVYWNRGAEQLYGYSRQQAIGRTTEDLLQTTLPPLAGDFQETLTRRGKWAGELHHRTADGRQITVESRLTLVRYADGQQYVLETTRDITERKRAERQLKTWNQTLERRVAERTVQLWALSAELSQTEQRERHRLARVLHDQLQQLLIDAKASVDLVRNQVQDDKLRQTLGRVDDVLEESLETSRSLTIELSPPILYQGNMSQILRWLGRWMHEKHGLAVQVEADENANPRAEEVRIFLFQAVRELLFNISKHAKVDHAGVNMTQAEDQQVRIVVSDEGIGFDPARDRSARHQDSGFGLMSIRERLGWMGGRLEIDSSPGKGTRITLLVPTRALAAEPDGQPEPAPAPAVKDAPRRGGAAPVYDGRKIRVLLADDHVTMRDGLARLLQMQPGIEVVAQASDGLQAVELTRQLQPQVVLMDVSMPGLNGMEATRQIVKESPHVRVIGLSMHAEEETAAAMSAAGACAYLTKTLPPDVLITTIRLRSWGGLAEAGPVKR